VRWKTAGTAHASFFEPGLSGFIQRASQCHAGYGRSWVGNGLLLAFVHQDGLRRGGAETSFSFLWGMKLWVLLPGWQSSPMPSQWRHPVWCLLQCS